MVISANMNLNNILAMILNFLSVVEDAGFGNTGSLSLSFNFQVKVWINILLEIYRETVVFNF